jgi:hypothetical protein
LSRHHNDIPSDNPFTTPVTNARNHVLKAGDHPSSDTCNLAPVTPGDAAQTMSTTTPLCKPATANACL